ncbi:MAG TPA: response regulator [Solimonas sp.]|nr:response regulator [Solimonas sp.]
MNFQTSTSPAVSPGPRRRSPDNPLRVLVVDDVKDVSDSLGMLLELSGYKVASAYDGANALGLLDDFRPEAVIVDLKMPRMTGLELVRTLRRHPLTQNATIVAITGDPSEQQRWGAEEAGVDHFFAKPVSLLKLYNAIGQPIGRLEDALPNPGATWPCSSS